MTPKKTATSAYRLGFTILYGVHRWLDRTDTKLRIPNAKMAKHMRLSAQRLRNAYYQLEDWGILESVRWNKYYTTVIIRPPLGMISKKSDQSEQIIMTQESCQDNNTVSCEDVVIQDGGKLRPHESLVSTEIHFNYPDIELIVDQDDDEKNQ
jgi:hypothetical protein